MRKLTGQFIVIALFVLALNPASLLADLKKEIIKADLVAIQAVIEQIYQQDPSVAEALYALANDFEHNKILRYLEVAGLT